MATLRSIATTAYQDLGVVGQGFSLSAYQADQALTRANRMMQGWTLQSLTIPVILREVFDTVVGKGGPDTPYTIGDGANLDTSRPPSIVGAGALLNSGLTTETEIPRGMLTPDAYEAIQVKRLTNPLFTDLYYRPDFASNWGKVFLWPIPSETTYKLVIYRPDQLSEFADLDTDYDLPPGAEEAIQYGLEVRLMLGFPIPAERRQETRLMARESLATFKRGNTKLVDLGTDPALIMRRQYGYNIRTDNSTG
jgi:hypothetical protein